MNAITIVLVTALVTFVLTSLASRRAARRTAFVPAAEEVEAERNGFTRLENVDDDLIETILAMHYRQVLADPGMQRVWRKLLSQASAVRTVEKLGR